MANRHQFALQALVAAGHVTQERVDRALEIAHSCEIEEVHHDVNRTVYILRKRASSGEAAHGWAWAQGVRFAANLVLEQEEKAERRGLKP